MGETHINKHLGKTTNNVWIDTLGIHCSGEDQSPWADLDDKVWINFLGGIHGGKAVVSNNQRDGLASGEGDSK